MGNVTLVAIGSLKEPWTKSGCEQYQTRLERGGNFSVVELPPSKQKNSDKQQQEESQRMLDVLKARSGQRWVLDERGKQLTSMELAKELGSLKDRGESLTIALGGAYGFTDDVRNEADFVWSLSDGVFPHELARVITLEQLYRASEIQRGSGYHH